MNTCKQCGRDFVYDDERGYARDLCGPFCDGVHSQQDKIKNLAMMLRRLMARFCQIGGERDSKLYLQAFDLLTRYNLHGQPLHGCDHD